ncbi:uncharacterized protein [Nicotiana sylvestris]|uniref:uncharacterized protein n=1 Tax=Nicotiana sylvestris TaxID=4096 RepID=UPI00388C34B6
MEENEMVKYFLQALQPTYYGHLISAIGKSFNGVVKIGEMVEEGLKSRHNIEKCWHLKRAIQELIDTNQIVVQSPDAPNINQNPLPAHAETHMIEIVHKDGEPKKSSKSVMMIRASERNLVKAPDSTKATPLTVEGMTEKPNSLNSKPPVLVMKGLSKDIGGLDDILNEAHVPDKITVNHLEKIVGRIFEANRITFSDDELPMEGTEHNRALYLTVKCEDSVVSRVLVDNGSSANICPLSTLQKLKIGTERIHLNSMCVRGFDGGGKDSGEDIMLELSIRLVEFTMEFQVLDVAVSYNLLLGKPWIHTAKAVPSSLHQMVKFEWDTEEIVVHGDEDLSALSVEKIPEGKCILGPKLSSASVMVANEMLKNGFVPGKGLGSSLQGIVHPVCHSGNPDTFGLGFIPTEKDMKKVKNIKQKVWSLSKPVPHISKSFVKPGAEKPPTSSIPKSVVDVDEELIKRFQSLFEEVNMVEVGEGSIKEQSDHVKDLRKFFQRLRGYNLKLNPAKCAFGVPSRKLLGFVVSRRDIELDPSKIKAIQELPPPKNKTEVMSLLGRLNCISKFIAQLTTTCEPIFKLMKKNAAVKWTDECQEAFDKIKRYLSNPPVLVPSEPGRPLILYLTVLDNSFGCVLGQHDITGKKEQAIYYLSKKFTPYEVKYTLLERTCCALTWVAQKLKHYLSSYTTYLISCMDPLKYIFQKSIPTGRLAKWQIFLTEFDITYVTRTAMKAQALADHLAENPVDDEYEPLKTYFPDEEVMCVDEVDRDEKPGWKLFFDGAANMKGVGVGVVLISETGKHYPVTAQLRFHCTNNMAEYEACLLGLRLAVDMGVQEILVLGDSDLLVHQIQREWETRDLKLIMYRQCLHDLCQRFRSVEFRHIPRIHNEIVDALATLASMLHHPDKAYVNPVHIQVHDQHAYCNVVEEEIDSEP